MIRLGPLLSTLLATVFVAGCSDETPPATVGGAGGSGGFATESGGATGTGGQTTETGGAVGSGGSGTASGGAMGTGGDAFETGGAPGSGGEAAGSGGAAAGSGGETSGEAVPSDTSEAGIEAFLAAGSYKSAPWIGDSAVRTPTSSTNVHGDVRVYYNPTAVTSRENGQNEIGHDTGNSLDSMSVKELYDDVGAQIGTAVMMRIAESGNDSDWLYYCESTGGGCASASDGGPYYGTALSECRFCHGGLFMGPLP